MQNKSIRGGALALVAIACVGALYWISRPPRALPAEHALAATAKSADHTPRATMDAESQQTLEAQAVDADERVSADLPETAEVSTDLPTASVFGSIVDDGRRGLPDVRVRLSAYQVWRVDAPAESFADSKNGVGYETTSDALGNFRFDVPVPTNEATALKVMPDRFLDAPMLRFGTHAYKARTALLEGERDLGEIQLVATGAITGRVIASDGSPLHGARLSIYHKDLGVLGDAAWSNENGDYVLGHAPVGTYEVACSLRGFLRSRVETVTSQAGRDTKGVDFVLEPAFTLSGHVTDALGAPIEKALVRAHRNARPADGSARTLADGSFQVFVNNTEARSLSCRLEGYDFWEDPETKHHPSAEEIEIVLQPSTPTRFYVVDSETQEPIEEFGPRVLIDNGSKSPKRIYNGRTLPKTEPHPGGWIDRDARDGVDLYLVSAPGYVTKEGDVEFATPQEKVQTLRLERGARVSGVLLSEGIPAPNVPVHLIGGSTFRMTFMRPEKEASFHPDRDLSHETKSDDQGRFEWTGLSPAEYRVQALPPAGVPLTLPTFKLFGKEDHDLGTLRLPSAAATIMGELLLPTGVETAGLVIRLDTWDEDITAAVASDGSFRFENLPPGEHTLYMEGKPDVLAETLPEKVDCEEGQTHHVTIDARDRGFCKVRLRLDFGDLSLDDVTVYLFSVLEPTQIKQIGQCDADGWIETVLPGWGETQVRLHPQSFRSIDPAHEPIVLVPFADVEQTIRIEFARARVLLAEDVRFPADGMLKMKFFSGEESSASYSVDLRIYDGLLTHANEWGRGSPPELRFDGLPTGSFRVVFRLEDSSIAPVQKMGSDGSLQWIKPSAFEAETRADFAPGEETLLQFF